MILPLKDVSELPQRVRKVLPATAQALYVKSYNRAYRESSDNAHRFPDDPHLRAHCHREAWVAVRERFRHDPEHHRWVEVLTRRDSDADLPPATAGDI